MSPLAIKIARDVHRLVGKPISNAPKDMPPRTDNVDNNLDGNYKQENLIDPGIKNMVTGSGRGPVIGGYNRSRASEGGWGA